MRKLLGLGGVLILLMLASVQLGEAKDLVLNDGFEVGATWYWVEYGTSVKSIEYFDVNGDGNGNFCFGQKVGTSSPTNFEGGITQKVYVIAGHNYTITADFAYYNC